MSADEVKKLIECPLEYSLSDGGGIISSGSAVGRIDEASASIIPRMGEPILFSPREILEFAEGDYTISLLLTSREKLVLSKLGKDFENFSRILSRARNEVVMKDMLMHEGLIAGGLKGAYEYGGRAGNCELRVYDTGLVVMVERGEPLRLHYGSIAAIAEGDHALTLTMENGDRLTVSRMGGQLEPFEKALNDAMNALALRAQGLIKEVAPEADASMARRAARLMRDGKAARKDDLDAISPAIWRGLERKIEETGILDEYDFLRSLAPPGKMCIGFKRGLMGDFTGDYIWILAPVYGPDPKKPGNAIIMEAVALGAGEKAGKLPSVEGGETPAEAPAEESGGRWATYIFRIAGQGEYPAADIGAKADEALRQINECMLAINFRREPVFLPDGDLELPKNAKYWYSVRRLPALQALRGRFVGRVVHVTREQWRKGVLDVLAFNVSAGDDNAKYKQ